MLEREGSFVQEYKSGIKRIAPSADVLETLKEVALECGIGLSKVNY